MDRPKIAVVDENTLALIGMKKLLQQVIPIMQVNGFATFEELVSADADSFFHFFVSQSIVLAHRCFFEERRHKTIVLSPFIDGASHPQGFHCLCVNQPESHLIKDLLALEQQAHSHGRNLPPMPKALTDKVLSNREVEVLSLLVQGYLNKEIAAALHISLTTVITHRKHIVAKLGMKSVSALTIYAVMHGYVDITKI